MIAMFLIGFGAWSLTFGRSLAWDARRPGLLCCIVGVDELTGILTGMWLAKHGTYAEGVACALGGMVAAYFILRRGKHD